MDTHNLLSRSAAAEWLALQLTDKGAEQWALFLRNNANHARRAFYRIPVVPVGRNAFYELPELGKFVEFEKSRQLGELKLTGRAAEALCAFGVGTASGSTTGRKIQLTAITPQTDSVTGARFVQIIMDDPLRVYRVDVAEAKGIVRQLMAAIVELEEEKS